jgi:hypothetical protein
MPIKCHPPHPPHQVAIYRAPLSLFSGGGRWWRPLVAVPWSVTKVSGGIGGDWRSAAKLRSVSRRFEGALSIPDFGVTTLLGKASVSTPSAPYHYLYSYTVVTVYAAVMETVLAHNHSAEVTDRGLHLSQSRVLDEGRWDECSSLSLDHHTVVILDGNYSNSTWPR